MNLNFPDDEPSTQPDGRRRRLRKKFAMFQNVKVTHIIQVILSIVAGVLPYAIKIEQGGYWQLPPWLIPVETSLLALVLGTGLVSPSVVQSVNVKAAMRKSVGTITSVIFFFLIGCSAAQVKEDTAVSLEAAGCVLQQAITQPPPLNYVTIAITCGIDTVNCTVNPNSCAGATEVANLLAQHEALRAKENNPIADGGK